MTKERRLGRGLEALLGRPLGTGDEQTVITGDPTTAAGIVHLNVYEIESNPFQPRREFDPAAIAELAASLQEHGLLQPLVVRRHGGTYQLIAGERRLRAAIKAGWITVPAQIREADDRQMAELAIVENLQRKDLDPLEKAGSFQHYLEQYGCTQDELAARLNIDRSTIANLIRLLELPEGVQQAIRTGAISQGHARALLPLGDEREQLAFCRRIELEALSVRATEQLVQEVIREADDVPLGVVNADEPRLPPRRPGSDQLTALAQEFRTALGTKVEIRQAARGRGKIVVHFSSHDEFERLRDRLCDRRARGQAG